MANGTQISYPESSPVQWKEERVSDPVFESRVGEKDLDKQSQSFPEGGWAGWATAIGAYVQMFTLPATIDLILNVQPWLDCSSSSAHMGE